MTTERIRELSSYLGEQLRDELHELGKDATVAGGGLRHGEAEWQIRYFWHGLARFLFFSIHEVGQHLLSIEARAAATDEEGRWAYVPVGSTTLPEEIVSDNMRPLIRSLLGQGRAIVNLLNVDDLHPLVLNYFDSRRK
jgi:hypothetical protein